MGVVNGTSIRGRQRLVGYGNINAAQFVVKVPAQYAKPIVRAGTFYASTRQIASPNTVFVLSVGALYLPAQIILFSGGLGFTAWQYAMDVEWNYAGLAWSVEFSP